MEEGRVGRWECPRKGRVLTQVYLLEVACTDVVVGQRTPQLTNHVREPPQPTSDDRLHLQTGDLQKKGQSLRLLHPVSHRQPPGVPYSPE